ncbi:hypothetical protein L1987_73431 [Smallanthus sonchifolius]|uniref:Uncharacterized protein n=1 Tax=Smallanthus sonchifolius TaxID=185202 RepID=A0ACB9A0P0_9ASTR|nr:hypothetical protein L1987_73431 [Smallanthus sonchifolius]
MENQLMLSYASDEVLDLSTADTELEIRLWNLFAVLLSIGRPVPPIELASRCTSIEASEEFVEFVCSVPNSPLSLTTDGLVTISSAVCIVLQRFLLNSSRVLKILLPTEMMMLDCGRKRARKDVVVTYNRKRRRLCPNGYEKADQVDLTMPFMIPNARAKVYAHFDDVVRSVIMNPVTIRISNGDRMLSLIKFDAGNLNCGLNGKHEDEKEGATIFSMKELGSKNSLSTSTGGFSHLTASSLVRIEDINGENCLLSKQPGTASSQADDNNKVISLVKACIDDDSSKANNNLLEIQSFAEGREYECILDSESHKGNLESLSGNAVYGGMIPELYVGSMDTLCCNDMTPCFGTTEKASCQEVGEHNIVPPTEAENLPTTEAQMDVLPEEEKTVCGGEELVCSLHGERDDKNPLMSKDMTFKDDRARKNSVRGKHISRDAELDMVISERELISFDQKPLLESAAKLEAIKKDTNSTVQIVSVKTNKGNDVGSLIEQKYGNKDKRLVSMKQKLKPNCEQIMHTSRRENIKENKEKASTVSVKGHSEPKVVPMFESYIVEEEEGSGGYGTVYKTRRKKDGTMFAVKYPHVNANRQHVYNELKMLERFGGKNFVIKYEGSFKSGNSHCLVLEHVAHDRPEVLKREIDVFQLRWYGYCLFRALASLHKQGVVHRDVKPGNFLFSRKASKGHLIDFNLATDLHQKLGYPGKSKSHNDAISKLVPPPHPEFLPPTRISKYTSSKALAAEAHSKMLFPKNFKKKRDHKDLNMHGVMKSQGADGSGITSTKDATSSKVPSGERFREPIPCKGRQEYLNLVQEALQSPEHEATITTNTTPVSKRKRVAAPPAKLDDKFMYLTPMPLQPAGVGLLKNKGDGKQRKEGSCVGTKGFRAPEVLLKSTYQGPKVDIWSAGVTLLYFIIGRTPFVGDPDQNIKEIAKLRGSEDLWEVAKLHDRESSFPLELLQVQSLASTKLQEWCRQNTRRPDFLEAIPKSLIDLVDKCLTVNPRSRISAVEALKHEFFVPCFNDLEKQRLNRQWLAHSNLQPASCQSSSMKNLC